MPPQPPHMLRMHQEQPMALQLLGLFFAFSSSPRYTSVLLTTGLRCQLDGSGEGGPIN